MGDPVSHDHAAASRATDLIADFQARHEAWRRQGENLARLRADARAAAAREATAILTAARGDIHRIVADARRALLALTAQLQAITEQPGGNPDDQDEQVPESVLHARRELQRLLTGMRPELDELAAHVRVFDEPAAPATPASEPPEQPAVEINEVEHDAALAAIAPLFEDAAPAEKRSDPGSDPLETGLHLGKRQTTSVLAVLGVTIAAAGGWWLFGSGSDGLAPPVSSIPTAPHATPGWLNDQVPTLTASLISLPSATSGARATMGVPSEVMVDVEVRRVAWVESSVDNGTPTSRTFQAGETFRLHGRRDISITVGDAGAVVVSLNGGPRSPLGPDGRVVRRHFIPGDAVSP